MMDEKMKRIEIEDKCINDERVLKYVEEILKRLQREQRERQTNTIDIVVEKKKKIEEVVKEILEENGIEGRQFIDISGIVKKRGFKIKTEPMDINTTGVLYADDKKKEIIVNTMFRNPHGEKDVVFKKSRFITAHEYGHYIMHKEQLGTPLYAHRDTDTRTAPLELEADYFARSILMPLNVFKEFYDEGIRIIGNDPEQEDFLIDVLSKTFGATTQKVRLRIRDIEELFKNTKNNNVEV